MKNFIISISFLLLSLNFLSAQTIKIQPYLQDAEPNSIYIMWETDSDDESVVEWGLTYAFGDTTIGIAYPSEGNARIHEVKLENLQSHTRYFYQVKTGNAVSEIFDFKTPPHASAHLPFRIIAMSDMQNDNSHPDKFKEIVEEGVMGYLEDNYGEDLVDNLALVMIPGDLVANGNTFSEWQRDFFNPGEKLFSHVPVYPVLGNHEVNSKYYFAYFKMPENGTAGFEEHWWHKDYGNVRIIGLNSNGPFDNPEQLAWLDATLAETCASDSIDFVFAQLHHPHKSELWTPGESDFTGEVIKRLEQFSTNCEKPSIHFFGHTHGYSRGQSRDHKHLWINVATAGGAIDNWGEFPNFDYDEFSVSQDDYGFVSIEITDDNDPKLVVKRISRGDQDVIIDNKITDSLVMRLTPSEVTAPSAISPMDSEIIPECITLEASPFSSPNIDAVHGQSHWQVSLNQNGFSQPVAESWKNFENWYFEEDTQAGDDLKDERILGLEEFTTYWWRVRYRDKEYNWSEWSSPVTFSTGKSISSPNLVINPGAENDLANWEIVEGVVEALTNGECNGIAPHSGNKYFGVGGLCEHSTVGRCAQNIDVTSYADSIDMGGLSANFGGFLSNFSGDDLPELKLIFFDEDSFEIGKSNTLSTLNNTWTMLSEWVTIPQKTRTIRIELKGTRNAGTDNDSYLDDLFLKIGQNNLNCNGTSSIINHPATPVPILNAVPNPMNASSYVQLPSSDNVNLSFHLIDSQGMKVSCPVIFEKDRILIENNKLASGNYVFWIRSNGTLLGMGKLLVL